MPLVQSNRPGQVDPNPTGSSLAHNWGIIAAHLNALRRRLDRVESETGAGRTFRDEFVDWLDLNFSTDERLQARILAGFDGAQSGQAREDITVVTAAEQVEKDDMGKRERDIYMVNVGPTGCVFVKTLEFFREQAGFTKKWGEGWQPVVATGIEDARERGCALPGARPYHQQAKP